MIIIAIDGTSASGKGFISTTLSSALMFPSLDTGALYRACALKVLESFNFAEGLRDNNETFKEIENGFPDGYPDNFFDITEEDIILCVKQFYYSGEVFKYSTKKLIRSEMVSRFVPVVAKIPEVREFMKEYQFKFAIEPEPLPGQKKENIIGAIIEGRDIGTVIYPNADLKLFITASLEARAKRRFLDYQNSGDETTTYEEVYESLKARDEADKNRAVSPLKPADDAIIIDTSDMDKNQVIDFIMKIAHERIGEHVFENAEKQKQQIAMEAEKAANQLTEEQEDDEVEEEERPLKMQPKGPVAEYKPIDLDSIQKAPSSLDEALMMTSEIENIMSSTEHNNSEEDDEEEYDNIGNLKE